MSTTCPEAAEYADDIYGVARLSWALSRRNLFSYCRKSAYLDPNVLMQAKIVALKHDMSMHGSKGEVGSTKHKTRKPLRIA